MLSMDDQEAARAPAERRRDRDDAFESARRQQLLDRLRFAIPVTMAVIVIDGLAQWATGGSLFARLLAMRVAAVSALGVLLVLTRASRAARMGFALSVMTLLVISVDVEAAILTTGGYASRFQTGLALVPVATALLLP